MLLTIAAALVPLALPPQGPLDLLTPAGVQEAGIPFCVEEGTDLAGNRILFRTEGDQITIWRLDCIVECINDPSSACTDCSAPRIDDLLIATVQDAEQPFTATGLRWEPTRRVLYVCGGDHGLFRLAEGPQGWALTAVDTEPKTAPGRSGSLWCFDVDVSPDLVVAVFAGRDRSTLRAYAQDEILSPSWNPIAPAVKREVALGKKALSPGAIAYAVEMRGRHAYVGLGDGGIARVHLVSGAVEPGPRGVGPRSKVRDLALAGHHLYAAAERSAGGGLLEIDLNEHWDPDMPVLAHGGQEIADCKGDRRPTPYFCRVDARLLPGTTDVIIAAAGHRRPVRTVEGGPYTGWGAFDWDLFVGGPPDGFPSPDVQESRLYLFQRTASGFSLEDVVVGCEFDALVPSGCPGKQLVFELRDLLLTTFQSSQGTERVMVMDDRMHTFWARRLFGQESFTDLELALPSETFFNDHVTFTKGVASLVNPDVFLVGTDGGPVGFGLPRYEGLDASGEAVIGAVEGSDVGDFAEDFDTDPYDDTAGLRLGLIEGAQWMDPRADSDPVWAHVEWHLGGSGINFKPDWPTEQTVPTWKVTRLRASRDPQQPDVQADDATLMSTLDWWLLPVPEDLWSLPPFVNGNSSCLGNPSDWETPRGRGYSAFLRDPRPESTLVFASRQAVPHNVVVLDRASIVEEVSRVQIESGFPGLGSAPETPRFDPNGLKGELLSGARMVAGGPPPPVQRSTEDTTCWKSNDPGALANLTRHDVYYACGGYQVPQLLTHPEVEYDLGRTRSIRLDCQAIGMESLQVHDAAGVLRTYIAVASGFNAAPEKLDAGGALVPNDLFEHAQYTLFDITDWPVQGAPAQARPHVVNSPFPRGYAFDVGIAVLDDGAGGSRTVMLGCDSSAGRVLAFDVTDLPDHFGDPSWSPPLAGQFNVAPNVFDDLCDIPVDIKVDVDDSTGTERVYAYVAYSRLGLVALELSFDPAQGEVRMEHVMTLNTPGQAAQLIIQETPQGKRALLTDHEGLGLRAYGQW